MNVLNVGMWWKVKSIIDKATSNDDSVTTGFVYNEINQMTNESDSHCQQVLDKVLSRLTSNEPIVKRKALLVIKSCIERGNPNFKRDLHQRVEELRAASNYSGPPDKLEGDAPYRRVREEANRVMNLLYDSTTTHTKKVHVENMEGNSSLPEGRLHHNYMDGTSGINPSSTPKIKLESLSNWQPPPEKKTITSSITTMGGTIVGGVSNAGSYAYNKVKGMISGTKGGEVVEEDYGPSYYVAPNRDFSTTGDISRLSEGSRWQEKSTRRKKGEVSGSWSSESDSSSKKGSKFKFDYSQTSSLSSSDSPSSTSSPSSPSSTPQPSLPSSKKSSKKQEEEQQEDDDEAVEAYCFKLVEEITVPVGLKGMDPSALNSFLKKTESLNSQLISFCLDQKLEDSNPKTVLNALTVIEALLNGKVKGASKYFIENPRNVELHTQSQNGPVKNKASSVLSSLQNASSLRKKKKKKTKKQPQHDSPSSSPLTEQLSSPSTTPSFSQGTGGLIQPNTNKPQQNTAPPQQQHNLLGGLFDVNTEVKSPEQNNTKPPTSSTSLLDDIKNLEISPNNNLGFVLPYPKQPYPTQPVYYQQPYVVPQTTYPPLYTQPPQATPLLTPQTPPTSSNNDSAFSFINDQIKKEVK